jgi:hypothetical protein
MLKVLFTYLLFKIFNFNFFSITRSCLRFLVVRLADALQLLPALNSGQMELCNYIMEDDIHGNFNQKASKLNCGNTPF